MRLWHMAAILVVGMAFGTLFPGRLTVLFGQATLYVFLPALIFEGAWHLDFRMMRSSWRPIALLAVVGVVVTAAIISAAAHFLGSFEWPAALLLGVILSATDPVAVVAIFRQLDVPARLATIVESEALLNDAIAVVLYRAILAALLVSPGAGSIGRSALQALSGVVFGTLIGLALAFLAAFALRERVGAALQTAATFAGAYGGYFLAEHAGCSGIFCVIAFAVALRELERRRLSVEAAAGVARFWSSAAAFANLVLFFLIGAALDFTRLLPSAGAAAVTVAAVLLSRAVVAYGLLSAVHSLVHRVWRTVVRMAGIRGPLSLALALAMPAAIAQRSQVVDATFVVVVLTLLVGSLTLDWRMRRLGLAED